MDEFKTAIRYSTIIIMLLVFIISSSILSILGIVQVKINMTISYYIVLVAIHKYLWSKIDKIPYKIEIKKELSKYDSGCFGNSAVLSLIKKIHILLLIYPFLINLIFYEKMNEFYYNCFLTGILIIILIIIVFFYYHISKIWQIYKSNENVDR